MVPDRQKVWTDGETNTISLRRRRGGGGGGGGGGGDNKNCGCIRHPDKRMHNFIF